LLRVESDDLRQLLDTKDSSTQSRSNWKSYLIVLLLWPNAMPTQLEL